MHFPFVKYKKIYYIFSGILMSTSVTLLVLYGLKFGIEFTGGSLLEAEFKGDRPSNEEVQKNLSEFNLGDIVIQPVSNTGMLLRFKEVDEATHQKVLEKIF